MVRQHPTIASRRELFDYLEEQMNQSYREVLDSRRLESESTYVKTFLLEFDWDEASRETEELPYLAQALGLSASRESGGSAPAQLSETGEEGFYRIDWRRSGKPLRMYLDTASDPKRRFWLGYSLSDAAELDAALNRLTASQAALDRVWLWPALLRRMQSRGEFRGIGLDYDNRRFEAKQGKPDSTSYLKLQLWGGPDTSEILDFISRQGKFRSWAVLSKVRLKYWDDPSDTDSFALEDIKYNGKLTTRGTSFSAHQGLVTGLRTLYAEKIRAIEDRHTIRLSDEDLDAGNQANPVFFSFGPSPIGDLDAFCEVVLSGHLPFRLWGTPRRLPGGEDGRSVSAVDLHTGSRLSLEIYHDVVCMYLYPGSCGNTVARFFTNLQQTFGRLVTGEDNERQSLF